MRITVTYPKAGTAANPTVLPRAFVVTGMKGAAEQPIGVIVRGNGANMRLYGGTTITPKNPRAGGAAFPNTQWAMKFELPAGIRRNERLRLCVMNGTPLGNNPAALPTGLVTVNDLVIRGGFRLEVNPGRKARLEEDSTSRVGGPDKLIVEPGSGSTIAKAEGALAYGYLVGSNNDINAGETMFMDLADDTKTHSPSFTYEDGTGFWAAFFDPFPASMATSTAARLVVVYSPFGNEETVESITLT